MTDKLVKDIGKSEVESMAIVRLGEIAYARSGDKGADANVGVIAYSQAGYEVLRAELTSERIDRHFAQLELTGVDRYELPNLGALNFMLRGALGLGGSRSLRIDAQGKAFAAAVLEIRLEIGERDLDKLRRKETA